MDFNQILAQFWQLQVPVTLVPDPGGGILAYVPYGERIHFTTPEQISFFLMGFRLGTQKQEPMTPPPWMMPAEEQQQ